MNLCPRLICDRRVIAVLDRTSLTGDGCVHAVSAEGAPVGITGDLFRRGSVRDLGRRSGGLSATWACGEQIFGQMPYVLGRVTFYICTL